MWITTILHFFADMATSIFQPLGPYFTEKFSVSPRVFAMTLYAVNLTSSMLQPYFGLLSDRITKRNIYLAIVISITLLSAYMISLATSFLMVVIFAFLAQLSNSAFHPMGASIAGQGGKGKNIAFFTFAGMLGYATGPVFITWYAQKYNLEGLHFLGITLFVIAIATIPRMKFFALEGRKKSKGSTLHVFKKLYPIVFYIAFRSFAMGLAQIYGPLYVKLLGGELVVGGSLLTITRFVGMGLSFLGVYIRSKFSNHVVNIASASAMTIFGLMFTLGPKDYILPLFVAMLAPAYLSMSSNVAEAQYRVPESSGLASSLVMGMAWSMGSLMNLVFSSIFGNDVRFMISSFWIVSGVSLLFSILDVFVSKSPEND